MEIPSEESWQSIAAKADRLTEWPISSRKLHVLTKGVAAAADLVSARRELAVVDLINIKGLRESVELARSSIAKARSAPTRIKESADALAKTCESIATQVDAMHSDIKFDAENLGNSGGSSEEARASNGSATQ